MVARCSLLTEPWWARASSGAAPLVAPACAIICAGMPETLLPSVPEAVPEALEGLDGTTLDATRFPSRASGNAVRSS